MDKMEKLYWEQELSIQKHNLAAGLFDDKIKIQKQISRINKFLTK